MALRAAGPGFAKEHLLARSGPPNGISTFRALVLGRAKRAQHNPDPQPPNPNPLFSR